MGCFATREKVSCNLEAQVSHPEPHTDTQDSKMRKMLIPSFERIEKLIIMVNASTTNYWQ